jgi:hypothetical protein
MFFFRKMSIIGFASTSSQTILPHQTVEIGTAQPTQQVVGDDPDRLSREILVHGTFRGVPLTDPNGREAAETFVRHLAAFGRHLAAQDHVDLVLRNQYRGTNVTAEQRRLLLRMTSGQIRAFDRNAHHRKAEHYGTLPSHRLFNTNQIIGVAQVDLAEMNGAAQGREDVFNQR